MIKKSNLIGAVLIFMLATAFADVSVKTFDAQLATRLSDVLERIDSSPKRVSTIFSPEFNATVSEKNLLKIFSDLYASVGKCSSIARSAGSQPTAASYLLKCERGYVPIDLSIDSTSPHLINGFFIHKIFIEVTRATSITIIQGIYYPQEVEDFTVANKCTLPTASEIIKWALDVGVERRPDLQGFYWLAPQTRQFGFSEYIHLPSMKIVEYGNNVFQAKMVVTCNSKIV